MSFSLSRKQSLRTNILTIATPGRVFMASTMVINGGNYLYNLVLGRALGPGEFAEAGIVLTVLLLFSFLAMTFQLTATKYVAGTGKTQAAAVTGTLKKWALVSGLLLTALLLLLLNDLTAFLKLSDNYSLAGIIIALPVYFLMSVDRGTLQGREQFIGLSANYQVEFWTRSLATILIFAVGIGSAGSSISLAIAISLLTAFIFSWKKPLSNPGTLNKEMKMGMFRFFAITAGYELTQIFINYSDVFAVKHYFDNFSSGLYTSTSLVGKMIYFLTWMLVMMLLPKIIRLKKEGKNYNHLLYRTIAGVGGFILVVTLGSIFFGNEIVQLLFGEAFADAGQLLWLYAVATGFFALSNIFVFYFISLDKYLPVLISFVLAMIQLPLFHFFHAQLSHIILVQIGVMGTLLVVLVGYYLRHRRRG